MFLNLNQHVLSYNSEEWTEILYIAILKEAALHSLSFAVCSLCAQWPNVQTHNPFTTAASINRHWLFWSCEGGGWGQQVIRLMAYTYRWASERTEASISMQKHKHTVIAKLPLSRFRCSAVFQPKLKLTADPQNAKVTKIHVHYVQTDMWCNPTPGRR